MRHLRKNYMKSLIPAPAPPRPPRQELVIGFRPFRNPASAYSNGYCCLICNGNAYPNDTVICQGGEVVCTKCFLNGVPCKVGSALKVRASIPPIPEGGLSADDFVRTSLAAGYMDLRGETHVLEITVETPRNAVMIGRK